MTRGSVQSSEGKRRGGAHGISGRPPSLLGAWNGIRHRAVKCVRRPRLAAREHRSPQVADAAHYRRLERLYANAPVTKWFGASLQVDDGRATVRIPIRSEFYHAASAVHGSVYFRALDDAAFFAANSRVRDVLVLTVSFTVQFTGPSERRRAARGGSGTARSWSPFVRRIRTPGWCRPAARERHGHLHSKHNSAGCIDRLRRLGNNRSGEPCMILRWNAALSIAVPACGSASA